MCDAQKSLDINVAVHLYPPHQIGNRSQTRPGRDERDTTMNGFDDIQKFGKDNVDVALKSADAVSKGFQAIAAEAADYSKKSFEAGQRRVREAPRRQEPRQGRRGPVRLRPHRLRGLCRPGDARSARSSPTWPRAPTSPTKAFSARSASKPRSRGFPLMSAQGPGISPGPFALPRRGQAFQIGDIRPT